MTERWVVLIRHADDSAAVLTVLYDTEAEAEAAAHGWTEHMRGTVTAEVAAVTIPDRGRTIYERPALESAPETLEDAE